MKTTTKKIEIIEFENGDQILGYDKYQDKYIVRNSDGIFEYTSNEMQEIYKFKSN